MADKTPTPPTVTAILCICGKRLGTMTTAYAPHTMQIPKIYCPPCGEAMISKKLEKK